MRLNQNEELILIRVSVFLQSTRAAYFWGLSRSTYSFAIHLAKAVGFPHHPLIFHASAANPDLSQCRLKNWDRDEILIWKNSHPPLWQQNRILRLPIAPAGLPANRTFESEPFDCVAVVPRLAQRPVDTNPGDDPKKQNHQYDWPAPPQPSIAAIHVCISSRGTDLVMSYLISSKGFTK